MKRSDFLKNSIAGFFMMTTLRDFAKLSGELPSSDERTPLLFVGHGSPMNAIEDNEFSQRWRAMGKEIAQPAAVLCISAHWYTRGTFVTAMDFPRTIHDFGGFPKALSEVQYPAPGNAELAAETKQLINKTEVGLDHEWGLDHGTWSVVKQMYPEANIPVLQLSIDYKQSPQWHFELAAELAALRRKNVLIIGSGNMVHNLAMVNWAMPDTGYDWALEMNEKFRKDISEENIEALVNYSGYGEAGKLAIPTPDHYLPLLYTLGLKEKGEGIEFFNDKVLMGSVNMTNVKIG